MSCLRCAGSGYDSARQIYNADGKLQRYPCDGCKGTGGRDLTPAEMIWRQAVETRLAQHEQVLRRIVAAATGNAPPEN